MHFFICHNVEKGAQGHQGFPSRYGRFFNFIVLNVSKILMVIFWMILGTTKITLLNISFINFQNDNNKGSKFFFCFFVNIWKDQVR